ncbi:MAG: acyl-CoA dehydrogenase [Actinomycetia bacterium]|nr:acyl-CoA dehydrogenase [Actinomycetes bacterium]
MAPSPTLFPPDAALTADEEVVIDRVTALARDIIEPGAEQWELDRRFAGEAFEAAGAAALTGVLAPRELGGEEIGPVAFARMFEEIASADLAVAFILVVHNNLVGNVFRNGTEAMKAEVLPDLIAGRRLGAFLLTEPGFGSDAASIECQATRDGDTWVLDGEKAWVTNASAADVLSVYAQTDPALGHRGIIAFLVDADAPGVGREEPYELLGAHAMGTGGFRFEGVRLTDDDVLVPQGSAFRAAMEGIDLARVIVGAMCCGMLQKGLDVALERTTQRHLFGSSVADKQGIQWMLADVATDLEASRLLTYRAARLLTDGADATLAAAHAKKFAARAAQDRLADCMQTLGAAGYRRDPGNPLPRHLASARLSHYIDGTTEIQNVVIARRLWA